MIGRSLRFFIGWGFLVRLLVILGIVVGGFVRAEQEPVEVAIIGRFGKGPLDVPVKVGAAEFDSAFGTASPTASPTGWPAEFQARRFFAQGATSLHVIRVNPDGSLRDALLGTSARMTGMYALPLVRDLGIVLCPELTLLPIAEIKPTLALWHAYLLQRKSMTILDPPPGIGTVTEVILWKNQNIPLGSSRMAMYYPYLVKAIGGVNTTFGASGAMAGAWLASDSGAGRGVWKSPAGTTVIVNADNLWPALTSAQLDPLNAEGIAVLLKNGSNVLGWGARHLDNNDAENKYIFLSRTLDWVGTNTNRLGKIAAARENQLPLWNDLKAQVEAFLHGVYLRQGLQGTSANQAYFVYCGLGQTMTQSDVDAHRVKMIVGVALLKPSEFLLLQFTWNTRGAAYPPPLPVSLLKEGVLGKQLYFLAPPGATYQVEASPDLSFGSWIAYGLPVLGDGTWRQAEFVPVPGRRFFRVLQTRAP